MSVMDLSIQKGLGLSMKSNDYNDNNISIPPYINNHNEQNNAYRLNQEVNNEEITSTSQWDNLHNFNTLENLQKVKEELMEDVNDGHIEDVTEDSVTTMYQENYPYSIQVQQQNPEAKINNSEQPQFSVGILQTSQMTNLVNSAELQVTQETAFQNDDNSSIVQTQVTDLSNSGQQHEIQESSFENYDNYSLGKTQLIDLSNSAEEQVKEENTPESEDNSMLAQTQVMDLSNSAEQKVKAEASFENDDNSSIAQTQVMNLTNSTKQQVTEELDIENVSTSSDQQVTEKIVFENDDVSSIAQAQGMDVSTSSEQQVKDEPSFENDDSSSKPHLEMTFQDYNTWHPNWNGYQGFHPNQVANGLSSNPELNLDIKPDLSNQYYNSYGQQQHFGHFQQFYGSYPPNQNIPQPFQPHQQIFSSNPWVTPNGFYPNFGAQPHHYQNSPMWNSYSHPSSQFQYGPNPYMQQNYTWENGIKTEINIKNEDTSDLGSSFNSINSLDDNTEITSTDLNIKEDKETLTSTENPYAYDWVSDETLLPKGWKKRVYKNGKPTSHYFFLSPTNQKFESKTSLSEYMERNPGLFSQNDIEKLKPNGELFIWIPDETLLPKGWKKRVYKNGKQTSHYYFVSPTNDKFTSKSALLDYMEKNRSSFTESDIYKLRSTMFKGSGSGVKQYSNWDDSDSTLPKGWFKRYCDKASNGKPHRDYQYLSPKREMFASRSAVVLHMRENSYSKEDIHLFLSGKLRNGRNGKLNTDEFGKVTIRNFSEWTDSDPTLPNGWFKRHSEYVESNGRKHKEYQYLSPNQKKFPSRNAVVAFMTQSGQYSQEDIELVLSGRGHSSKTAFNDSRNYTEWTDSDPTLPKGWFKRHSVYSDPSGRKHTEYQYLSPNQQKLTSRNAVVAFMTQSGQYSQEDIELVLSGRGQSGKTAFNDSRNYTEWTDSDQTLPKGWFKRHSVYSDPSGRKHTEYQYLSPNQQKFSSRNAVVAFMTQSGQYSQEDIELVLSGRGHSSRPTYTGFQ